MFGVMAGALLLPTPAAADTILLKDGSELKGVIVEEFADRVTLSAEGGEQSILAAKIERIIYDAPEQSYIRQGNLAFDRELYDEATRRYQQALQANPKSLEAKQRLVMAQTAAARQRDQQLRERVARAQAAAQWRPGKAQLAAPSSPSLDPAQRLEERLGLALEMQQEQAQVSRVVARSPVAEAGIRQRDRLVAVAGRPAKYVPLPEMIRRLSEGPDHSEARVTIERDVELAVGRAGVALALRDVGLVVDAVEPQGSAAEVGVKAGDRVVTLAGQPTRYMPLREAERALGHSESGTVPMTFQRDVSMWRQPVAEKKTSP